MTEAPDTSRREFIRTGAMLAGAALMPPGAVAAGTSRGAMREYLSQDATGLAALLKRGEVSAAELLELAIARTETVNPAINAVCRKHYEAARAALKSIDPKAPLAGVPFLLKDLGVQLKGTVTSNGSRFFADRVATHTSTVVQRYQAAGLNIFGKTASPEFGMLPNTISTLWGRTLNPWNPEYSAGGSSGGAAAAVAAGIVPVAHATDGGGSIRFPAALCGLVGLKPTRARTPLGPDKSEGWAGLSCGHVVSRSVRDTALLLDLTQGPEPGAAYWPPTPAGRYVSELEREPARLRIAVVTQSPLGSPVHQDCLDAVRKAADLCRSLGHELHETVLPEPFVRYTDNVGPLPLVGASLQIRDRARELGREPGAEDLEPVVLAVYHQSARIGAVDYEAARQTIQRLGFAMSRFMQDFDVLLMPVSPRPPWKVGDFTLDLPLDKFLASMTGCSDFTVLYNCTGQPAITLPLHRNAAGMPVGTMFGARYGDEATLLRLAAQLERVAPWGGHMSPLFAEALQG